MEPESGRLTSPGGAAKRAIRPSTLPTRPAIRDESDATNSDTSLAALRKTLEPVGRMFNPDDVSLKFSPLASPDLKKLAIPSPDIDKLIAAASAPTLQTPSAVSLFLQSLTGVSAAGGAAHSPTTPILAFSPFGVIGGLPVGVALTPTGSGSSSASESAPLPGPSTVPSGLPDMAQTLAVTASVSSSLAPLMVPLCLASLFESLSLSFKAVHQSFRTRCQLLLPLLVSNEPFSSNVQLSFDIRYLNNSDCSY